MNFLKSSSLVIYAAMVTMCCGHISGSQFLLQDISPQVYCGRNLARVLAMLCFDEPSNDKRSETGTMYNSILSPYYKHKENQAGWLWVPSHEARSMAGSRGKRFVVSECCDKACSVSELLSYYSILSPYYKHKENQAGWLWVPSHEARSMAGSRGKRFVVSECCDKACSVSELLSYC